MLMTSIRHGFGNLTNFNGRDSRALFWPYALLHIGLLFAIWTPIFLAEFFSSLDRTRAFAEANPDKATITQGPGQYRITIHEPNATLMPDMEVMLMPLFVLVPIFVLLTAAAITRRLHDRGLRGWIGAIPAVLCVAGSYMMMKNFGQISRTGEPDFASFFAVFFLTLAYNASLIILIIFLCLPTKPQANQFGEPPLPPSA